MKKKQIPFRTDSMNRQEDLENRYVVVVLFLAFFIFTFLGAGNFIIVSGTGLLLCMVGLMRGPVRTDPWILVPLILYVAIGYISGLRTYGNTLDGYASTQSVFPVIYLLMSYLNDRERTWLKSLCSLWVGGMAPIGILEFTMAAFHGGMGRLSGIMGNPNAMGAMLVLGWFAVSSALNDVAGDKQSLRLCLHGAKYMMLVALALTMSIGAIGSLGVGLIAMIIYWKRGLDGFFSQAADIIFAMGCGVLLYAAANFTYWPWLSVAICIFILFSSSQIAGLEAYFRKYRVLTRLVFFAGLFGLILVLLLRPNALATFEERIAMMRNGLGYITDSPLLGIGPYQWRRLNLYDGDTYFNTWHIHNIFLHVGVELGLVALGMLLITLVRHALKQEDGSQRGEFAAAITHNLMDTSFFYMATVPFLIMTSAKDEKRTRALGKGTVRGIFGVFAVLFLWNFILSLK